MIVSCKSLNKKPIASIVFVVTAPITQNGCPLLTEYSEFHSTRICIMLPCVTEKEFFDAVKAWCFPGNQFQKLKVVPDLPSTLIKKGSGIPKPNNTIVLTLRHSFSLFKKLGIKAKEHEGLLAQAACHTPPTLDQAAFDQLITAAILSKGKEKPSSNFMGQVILNASQTRPEAVRLTSPFVY
ncbi:hypothetical protein O181_086449 [Austropuccinia psidii MF-1]|uniref:Uncharacterized protein n=1 Tax=Austropuccinia psidii MF-1 TaxID=1389203 RepID=A0A9Q3FX02_9BASI|nr:hypothetical protein [Austropuccinia psidii MF-1]